MTLQIRKAPWGQQRDHSTSSCFAKLENVGTSAGFNSSKWTCVLTPYFKTNLLSQIHLRFRKRICLREDRSIHQNSIHKISDNSCIICSLGSQEKLVLLKCSWFLHKSMRLLLAVVTDFLNSVPGAVNSQLLSYNERDSLSDYITTVLISPFSKQLVNMSGSSSQPCAPLRILLSRHFTRP